MQRFKRDKRTIQALASLPLDGDGKALIEALEGALASQDRLNRVEANDALLRIGQGRAQVLQELLEAVEAAPETLHKIMNSGGRG